MFKTPEIKKKHAIIISVTLAILLVLIVIMGSSQKCKVSDFRYKSPVESNSSGFTKESACKKALAICTRYSSWPMNCKIKE